MPSQDVAGVVTSTRRRKKYAKVHPLLLMDRPLETALPASLLNELGPHHPTHAPRRAAVVEDQGSTSNVHAGGQQMLMQLMDTMPHFQAGNIRTYTMQPLPSMMQPTAPTQPMHTFVPGVDLTIYIPRQLILQHICAFLGLPVNSVHPLSVGDSNCEGYISMGIPPDSTSSWTTTVPMMFHGAHMPTEYAAVESAAESVISYLCTQKNIKIDDINGATKKQLEECYGACVTYYQNIAEKAQQQTNTLWLRYNDLLGMIKYICIQSAGFLPIYRRRRRNTTGRVTVTPVYAGSRRQFWCPHKLARSLTGLLRHKRDTELALHHQATISMAATRDDDMEIRGAARQPGLLFKERRHGGFGFQLKKSYATSCRGRTRTVYHTHKVV